MFTEDDIVFNMTDCVPNTFLSNSLYQTLCETKIQIEQTDGWDNYKKLTNPFEFIHTVVPNCKSQVSRLVPLSRSFYKMIEICTHFDLFNLKCNNNDNNNETLCDYINNINIDRRDDVGWYTHDGFYNVVYRHNCQNKNCFGNDFANNGNNHNGNNHNGKNSNSFIVKNDKGNVASTSEIQVPLSPNTQQSYLPCLDFETLNKITSFHLAEGPGGFIEAVCYMRNNPNDTYYGMTLTNNDSKCPGWKKSKRFLDEHPNVIIEKGIDETGNLLSKDNFVYCHNKYKNTIDLVTGDGGVDFSDNFNNQEHVATKLIIAQVVYALSMQANNGNFVLKVFDTFSMTMVDILYLLSCLYKSVYVMKPQTSRYANSERYIVCKGFNLEGNETMISTIIEGIYDNFDNLNSKLYIESFFSFKHVRAFFSKIEEINTIMGKNQIENIINTLNLIINKNFEKIEYLKKHNIQKCIKWCETHNIPHNKHIQNSNVFLTPPNNVFISSVAKLV
jgi:23S rRNA U2552 (ribose-2'-O)-methylase RlmE/FtsJ